MIMSAIFKNMLCTVSLIAVLFLTVVNAGGAYLHEHIHHHASQQESDDCPIVSLATQAVFLTAFVLVLFSVVKSVTLDLNSFVLPSRLWHAYAISRAPPVVRFDSTV